MNVASVLLLVVSQIPPVVGDNCWRPGVNRWQRPGDTNGDNVIDRDDLNDILFNWAGTEEQREALNEILWQWGINPMGVVMNNAHAGYPEWGVPMRGDVNWDGKLNLRDIEFAAQYATAVNPPPSITRAQRGPVWFEMNDYHEPHDSWNRDDATTVIGLLSAALNVADDDFFFEHVGECSIPLGFWYDNDFHEDPPGVIFVPEALALESLLLGAVAVARLATKPTPTMS